MTCVFCSKKFLIFKGEKQNIFLNVHAIYANTVSRKADKGHKDSTRHLCVLQQGNPQVHATTYTHTDTGRMDDSTNPKDLM